MNFDLNEEQKMIINSAREIAKAFAPEYWREIILLRLTPVTQQMALNYIG